MAPVDLDLLRSLEQLQDAADAVFGRIATRVAAEHDRLRDLSRRIGAVKATVDSISGSRQAITVLSSAKYPQISSDDVDFRPLFGGIEEPLPVFKVDLHAGNFQQDGNEGTLELFRFFLETSNERSAITSRGKDNNMDLEFKSIADILPFSLREHRLTEQVIFDSSAKSKSLYPPPQSLTRGNKQSAPGLEEYGFRPTLRQVPLFSLPSKIPDLPMVADISWSGSRTVQELSSIVPSASNKAYEKVEPVDFHPSTVQSPPPPLPPLPPKLPGKAPSFSKNPEDIKGNKVLSPPPPPPPPPPLPSSPLIGSTVAPATPSKDKASASSPSSSQAIPPIGPERAALLASIRSPDIKLRKTELSEKTSGQNQEEDHATSKQADLLAEMASTLKMRRLSMKGATVSSTGSSSSARTPLPISNLKAFISQPSSSDGDEDDWEE